MIFMSITSYIINVFNNFVPSKTIIFKDKDPPWMNNKIKQLCQNKAKIYVKRGRTNVVTKFSANLILDAKTRYHSCLGNKLNNPQLGPKAYWSILNKFLDKKKIPLIPLLFNNSFITNTSLFNYFFAQQYTLIKISSMLLSLFEYKTNIRIDTVTFSEHNILSIIRSLNQNKAHGWDNVSTRMIKICDIHISGRRQIFFLCIKKIVKI